MTDFSPACSHGGKGAAAARRGRRQAVPVLRPELGDTSRAYRAGAATAGANYSGTDSTYAEGRTTDNAEGRTADYAEGRTSGHDAMTRSEERLNVDTQVEPTGRARLRKYVVTEQQQVTVPVEREEVRLEREPITDANRDAAVGGPAITESEHEVTLHAERRRSTGRRFRSSACASARRPSARSRPSAARSARSGSRPTCPTRTDAATSPDVPL